MPSSKRYLFSQIQEDLEKKMVFVSGPRQVGKTTLSKQILGAHLNGYLNWDIPEHREQLLKRHFPAAPIWVFDELHKYRTWRNFLKGVYDQFGNTQKILVTGSARLDLYRLGGDSLQGRHYDIRLHPLSVAELGITSDTDFEQLFLLGGFPEPFFSGSEIEAKRWARLYRQRLIQEDVVSLEQIKDLGNLELLMMRLPALVGSPLSINALREELQLSHKTVTHWVEVFTKLYAIFRLMPMGSPAIRAVKKEQKHYHFDWSLVENEGARFENMVACHLLKWAHFLQDTQGKEIELRYFRDIEGREIDFVLLEKNSPKLAVECKLSDTGISPHLIYFKKKFPDCQMVQLTCRGTTEFIDSHGIHCCPARQFLTQFQ